MTEPTAPWTGERRLFRHALATLAYRAGRACGAAPAGFGEFQPPGGVRTPAHIQSHLADLVEWMAHLLGSGEKPARHDPGSWDHEVQRFFTALERLDARVATGEPFPESIDRLLQGPLADALTHVGQIAMMRRMAGSPVPGESYFRAEVTPGRVGMDPPPPA